MTRTRLLIGLALVLIGLGVVALVLLDETDPVASSPASPKSPPTQVDASPERRADPAADPPAPERPASQPKAKLDRAASDRMREQIQRSLDSRSEGVPSRSADPASARADEGEGEGEPPTLDREYIRERIKEDLVPVAIECYESALADDPELGGKLVMKFAILGDPEVGGVVDEAAVGEESTLTNEFVRECMRESMMAISFDAPPEGGRLEVTYPFEFAPDDEE